MFCCFKRIVPSLVIVTPAGLNVTRAVRSAASSGARVERARAKRMCPLSGTGVDGLGCGSDFMRKIEGFSLVESGIPPARAESRGCWSSRNARRRDMAWEGREKLSQQRLPQKAGKVKKKVGMLHQKTVCLCQGKFV